jgi:hypothetical protein
MLPRLIPPSFCCTTCTTGAKQFVVQLAAVMILSFALSYAKWFTPYTTFNTGSVASFTGALTNTRFTPRSKYGARLCRVRNSPEHSSTSSTPCPAQSTAPGVLSLEYEMRRTVPVSAEVTSSDPSTNAHPCRQVPWIESYFARYAHESPDPGLSLMCTNSSSGWSYASLNARRPMRPKPFMPTLTIARAVVCGCVRLWRRLKRNTRRKKGIMLECRGEVSGRTSPGTWSERAGGGDSQDTVNSKLYTLWVFVPT